jgi:hypothetical protein
LGVGFGVLGIGVVVGSRAAALSALASLAESVSAPLALNRRLTRSLMPVEMSSRIWRSAKKDTAIEDTAAMTSPQNI